MSTYCERERNRLMRLSLLPYSFKPIGLTLFILAFAGLVISKFYVEDPNAYRTVLRHLTLIGLLFISISREKTEDEMMVRIRAQSFALAFIAGVIYAVFYPYLNVVVDAALGQSETNLGDISVYQVMVFMLLIQIGFFYQIKRMHA
ncbi:MAG: hypothetical protein GYB31_03370 [Bacteroidetes bacterium]|nr:hypothetical protein [Bacteroidota bacterium]